MGKGSRVRASRQVARRPAAAPQAAGAFGVGTRSRVLTGPQALRAWVDGAIDRGPDPEVAWRAAARVTKALPRLEELAVDHLRVDGASWVQIGRALGISRQGARQRFG